MAVTMGKSAAEIQLQALTKTKKKQKGKKNRKIGRYSKHPSSVRYRGERRWERNKIRRMERHLKRYPDDLQAKNLLSGLR